MPRWPPSLRWMVGDPPWYSLTCSERLSPSNGPQCSSCNICGEGFCGDAVSVEPRLNLTSDHRVRLCRSVRLETHESIPCTALHVGGLSIGHACHGLQVRCSTPLQLTCRDNWTEMHHLGIYLGNNEHMSAQYIYKQILEWLRSPEGLDSGGILAMMNRADINLRLRTGMADEMQQAVMSAGDSASESRICGGCADEILCVSK